MSEDFEQEFKDMKMNQFLATAEKHGFNMAVMFYMVGALRYFDGMDKLKVSLIAIEIAWLGTKGINPAFDGYPYRLKQIPDKPFSGYHLLAYYYVTWMLAFPDHIKEINLPYEREFNAAQIFYKK